MRPAQTTFGSLLTATCADWIQNHHYWGPEPFGNVWDHPFQSDWEPTAIPAIQDEHYLVILDAETRSKAMILDATDTSRLSFQSVSLLHGPKGSYGNLLRSIFKMVRESRQSSSGGFVLSPFLHGSRALYTNILGDAFVSDEGSLQMHEYNSGSQVVLEFEGMASSVKIKAEGHRRFNYCTRELENTTYWLKYKDDRMQWTSREEKASQFFLADANLLLDLIVEEGSSFNPLEVSYQLNETDQVL